MNPSHQREAPVDQRALILFDGVCNLCNDVVQFIIERDANNYFQFASLQSKSGQSRLPPTSPPPSGDTLVLIEAEEVFVRSTAALKIARRLRAPWPFIGLFLLVPSPLRDWIYNQIARNRYRWFGKREQCMVPSLELRDRFLDPDAP